MTRQEAIASGSKRYHGKLCIVHEELRGERMASNGNCVACVKDAKLRWQSDNPELHRSRDNARRRRRRAADPDKYRAKGRAKRLDPAFCEWQAKRVGSERYLALRRLAYVIDGGRRKARAAKRRATQLGAIPANADVLAINRAFAKLSRKAKRLGMAIDHIVPLRPCRVCSDRGTHDPSNWQLLSKAANSSKGNRCMGCWEGAT